MKTGTCLMLSLSLFCTFTGHAGERTTAQTVTHHTPLNLSQPSVDDIFGNMAQDTEWSLEHLNAAQWSEDLPKGQFPVYARAQVLLSRKYVSPGAIDGRSIDLPRALNAYQIMSGLPNNGELNRETWQSLMNGNVQPAFKEYSLTASDLNQPYLKSIPTDYAEQGNLNRLHYANVVEMLGEKFHMDESFLKKLNPKATFNKVGEKIIVANVNNDLPKGIHSIIAHKGMRQLFLMNQQNKIIAAYPSTIGSDSTPSPTGTHHIKVITHNPTYSYNPKTFGKAGGKSFPIAPGPNNPVGSTWIGLSKPSFGIHGTPTPSLISRTASLGCVRLTNWDASNLARNVKTGMTVKFLE